MIWGLGPLEASSALGLEVGAWQVPGPGQNLVVSGGVDSNWTLKGLQGLSGAAGKSDPFRRTPELPFLPTPPMHTLRQLPPLTGRLAGRTG